MSASYLPDYVDQAVRPRGSQLATSVIARLAGWLALGVWMGGQLVSAFYVEPAAAFALNFALLRDRDRMHDAERFAGWIFGGVADRFSLGAGVCFIVLLLACIIDSRASDAPKWVAYGSVAATLGAGVALVAGVSARWATYGGSGEDFAALYSQIQRLAAVQIGLLAVVAFLLVWLQTAIATGEEAPV